MSTVHEFRIPLPLSVEEYRIAQLYSVAEASKNETGGGEGIEILINEPFSGIPEYGGSGQHTHKVFHLSSKVPDFRGLSPKGWIEVHERARNAYPYCRTEYSNPDYMKENFKIEVITWHKEERVIPSDTANKHHTLTESELAKRTVDVIDIVNDFVVPSDYKPDEDPAKFLSKKTGRVPLSGADWYTKCEPYMCCYKLFKVEFKWFGLQRRFEKMMIREARRLLLNFHRQLFCWMDKWHGLTIENIRLIEQQTENYLKKQIREGEVKGMVML